MADVSISVVVYRDFMSPFKMINSLADCLDGSLDVRVLAVDNSNLPKDDPLIDSQKIFVKKCQDLGFVEYVDAGDNLGFGKANNMALQRSDAEYHAFVNPDVLFTENAIGALKRFMDSRPSTGMCIPRMVDEEGRLQKVYRREVTVLDAFNRMVLKNALKGRDRSHTMADEDYSRPFLVPFGQGSFLFGRTELLKTIGGFDDSYFMYLEDADLCKRINQISRLEYCPYATVTHKWEKGSHKNPVLFKYHIESYITYFKKWGLKLA